MRHAPALLAASFCVLGISAQAEASEHDSHAQAVVAKHVDGWNNHDASVIGSQFAEDADHVASNGKRTVGRAEIEANYKRFLNGQRYGKSSHKTKQIHVRPIGSDTLLVDVETTVSGILGDAGEALPDREGIYTLLLTKKGAGWQIAALRSMVPRETAAK